MKGTSTLKVNEATIIEAMQMMVDATFAAPCPKVMGVEFSGSGRGMSNEMTLELQVVEAPPA